MGCFKPCAIGKIGLIQSETLLNVEDYMLICAPFQFPMHRAVLLVILSAQEGVFFRQFRNKLGKISFTFAKNSNRDQVNFFVRAKFDRIGPMKGWSQLYLLDLSCLTCPNDLVEILGDDITRCAELRQQYETCKNPTVEISDETAIGDRKIRPQLLVHFRQQRAECSSCDVCDANATTRSGRLCAPCVEVFGGSPQRNGRRYSSAAGGWIAARSRLRRAMRVAR